MSKLEHDLSTAEPETVYGLLEQDGAVVVENILSADHLEKLNSELDALGCSTDPGLRHPAHERMLEFYGLSTIRFDGLPAKSEAFIEIMLTPLLCAAADHFLLPNCHDYIFNTGHLSKSALARLRNGYIAMKMLGASLRPPKRRWRLRQCLH